MTALRAIEPSRLDELAQQINAEHEQIWRAGRTALEHAVKAGEALLEAQRHVAKGGWLRWLSDNVTVHPTSAYKYMRLARYKSIVLADEVQGVEHGLRIIAAEPWHDRTRLSDDDKARMALLVEDEGLEATAAAFGVAKSTVWRWTSDKSPVARSPVVRGGAAAPTAFARGMEIDDELIERVADWLCKRFGDAGYFPKINDQVRGDALELIGLVTRDA